MKSLLNQGKPYIKKGISPLIPVLQATYFYKVIGMIQTNSSI